MSSMRLRLPILSDTLYDLFNGRSCSRHLQVEAERECGSLIILKNAKKPSDYLHQSHFLFR